MSRKPRIIRIIVWTVLVAIAGLASWVQWSPWPDPVASPLPWKPDAIVILGGGDEDRVNQGMILADLYPDLPVIVTGDGGMIVRGLEASGLPSKRVIHEQNAKSTKGNALLVAPILEQLNAQRVVLVTNWFHVPRSLAVFRHQYPDLEFAASFERKPEPLTKWDRGCQRRERLASVLYLFRYGVWSW